MSLTRTMAAASLALALLVFVATPLEAKIFFHEKFDSLDGWVQSEHRHDYGKIDLSAGPIALDEEQEQGLHLTQDAHFYAISKKLPTPVENDGKHLVVSFSVKNTQDLNCGGAYLKFLPELDQKDFHGESKYWLMFGPDRCGGNDRVHVIINYNESNVEWTKKPKTPSDKLTHVYTLDISPKNKYVLYLDGMEAYKGKLEEDWPFLQPKEINDPDDKKPSDWVDDARIPDPDDKKPSDWDDEPAVIIDTTATKPEDWDDDEDGEWEAPEIPNPKYKGAWHPRMIENPAYKGIWEPKKIPNALYKEDKNIYRMPEALNYVGIDVWQVEGGSIFDNIIIGDDAKEVLEIVKTTYGDNAEKEREAHKKAEAKKAADSAPEAEVTGDKAEPIAEEEQDL